MPFSDGDIEYASREFWRERQTGTQSARHDKAFLELIANELSALGWPAHISSSFHDPQAVVAGHFRVSKSWDIVCRDSSEHPKICVEFKSQVDSYGNNENNRYEEALGSGLDLRARYGNDAVLGFFLVICDEEATRKPTRRVDFPGLDATFSNTSHIDRRVIFAERIVEFQLNDHSLYDAAALLFVARDGSIVHPINPDLLLTTFPDRLVRAAGPRR